MTDWELLERYAATGDSVAFTELVRRHIGVVHGAAQRLASGHAEDVTQAVFLLLAQKAKKLRPTGSLVGWLHSATRWCCANLRKTELHRREREQAMSVPEVQSMESQDPEAIACLDAALGSLAGQERDAVLLRHFERKSFDEAGSALGISAEAARKRSERGLDKLRRFFVKRGYVLALTGVAALAERASATPFPPQLVARAAAMGVREGGSVAVKAIVRGVLRRLLFLKLLWVTVLGGGALAASAAVAVCITDASRTGNRELRRVVASTSPVSPMNSSRTAGVPTANTGAKGYGFGAITGRMVDSQGRPAANLMLRYVAFTPHVAAGKTSLTLQWPVAYTNGNGEFTLQNIGYVIGAETRPVLVEFMAPDGGTPPNGPLSGGSVLFDFPLQDKAVIRLKNDVELRDKTGVRLADPMGFAALLTSEEKLTRMPLALPGHDL